MLINFCWLILSYLIGSIPFGFLISKWSRGTDVRKVGRKQIGATNTFRNIGKWQGILTGILDVLKGWLVVFGAQKFGFSPGIQLFSGLVSVAGHNWPCYLRFFGGRGVATTLGAALALNPVIFGWAFIPFAILTLLWDGAVGTIFFLLTAFFLSVIFQQFIPVGLFSALVLFIILVKRLTGLKEELPRVKSKRNLIFNRLLLDRSEPIKAFPRWKRSPKT